MLALNRREVVERGGSTGGSARASSGAAQSSGRGGDRALEREACTATGAAEHAAFNARDGTARARAGEPTQNARTR